MVKEIVDYGIVACYRRSILIQSSVFRGEKGGRKKEGERREQNDGVIFF